MLLADASDEAAALHVAERLVEVVADPFTIGGEEIRISASVGIALSGSAYEDAEDLLRDADTAMYRAKAVGPGNCRVFDPAMHLRRGGHAAARDRSFAPPWTRARSSCTTSPSSPSTTVGSPVSRRSSAGVTGSGACCRRPSSSASAETSGLIVPIGWWALRQACAQMHEWQRRHDVPIEVSINVSRRLLMQDGMVDRLHRLLVETRAQPERLRLEVTEQVVSDHGDAAVARLRAVRSLGVRLSLDDFGTGYSSLRQLPELLCDAVKIDGSFLDGLTGRGDGSRLVESVLALAGGLGLSVVAEGVETAGQSEALRRLGCPQGQGYWFARPLEPDAAEELLTRPPGWWKSVD